MNWACGQRHILIRSRSRRRRRDDNSRSAGCWRSSGKSSTDRINHKARGIVAFGDQVSIVSFVVVIDTIVASPRFGFACSSAVVGTGPVRLKFLAISSTTGHCRIHFPKIVYIVTRQCQIWKNVHEVHNRRGRIRLINKITPHPLPFARRLQQALIS